MSSAAARAWFHGSPARPLLAATLVLRACINGVFMAWLLRFAPSWTDVFRGGAIYASADGAVGLLMGVRLATHKPVNAPATLVAVTLTDALWRLAAGAAILAFPGLPEIPITLVLFYGVIGAWAVSAGTIAIVAWVIAHRHAHAGKQLPSDTHALFDPLSVEGLIALMLAGYALVVGPPSTADTLRAAAAVATGTFALMLLIAAFGIARRHAPPAT